MSHSLNRLSTDYLNFDKPHLRASPLFNSDSEPPSYFEAVGLASHINYGASVASNEIYLNIDQAQLPNYHQQQNPQRIIVGNSNGEIQFSSNKDSQPNTYHPTPQRQQIIRTRDLQSSNPYYNYTYDTALGHATDTVKPSESYIFWSVFTTIYCVFLGLVALIFSIKVKHYNKEGLFQKAYSASKLARNFNIAGLFFGVVYLAIGLLVCFLPG